MAASQQKPPPAVLKRGKHAKQQQQQQQDKLSSSSSADPKQQQEQLLLIDEHLPPFLLTCIVLTCSGFCFVFCLRDFWATGKNIGGAWDEAMLVSRVMQHTQCTRCFWFVSQPRFAFGIFFYTIIFTYVFYN